MPFRPSGSPSGSTGTAVTKGAPHRWSCRSEKGGARKRPSYEYTRFHRFRKQPNDVFPMVFDALCGKGKGKSAFLVPSFLVKGRDSLSEH